MRLKEIFDLYTLSAADLLSYNFKLEKMRIVKIARAKRVMYKCIRHDKDKNDMSIKDVIDKNTDLSLNLSEDQIESLSEFLRTTTDGRLVNCFYIKKPVGSRDNTEYFTATGKYNSDALSAMPSDWIRGMGHITQNLNDTHTMYTEDVGDNWRE